MTLITRGRTSHKRLSKTHLKVVERSMNRVTTLVGALLCKRLILFCSEFEILKKIKKFFLSYSEISDLLQHS